MVQVIHIEPAVPLEQSVQYEFGNRFRYLPDQRLLYFEMGGEYRKTTLTAQENAFLRQLAIHKNEIVRNADLHLAICQVKGSNPKPDIVKVLASYVRKKMGELAGDKNVGHKLIRTILGQGYTI